MTQTLCASAQDDDSQKPSGSDLQPIAALFLNRRNGEFLFTGDSAAKAAIAAASVGDIDPATAHAISTVWNGGVTLVEWTEEVEGDGPDLLCQLELPVQGNTTSKPAAAPAARPLLAKGDWPLPRPIDLQHLCSVLSQIPYFSDGADGHVPVSLDSLAAFKAFIRDHYTAEEADKAVAPVLALEDLADAATRGADDDDLDLSALIGFYRAGNAVQKIVAPCITADESGDGLLLVMGTLRIPGTQVGTDVKFGGLSAKAVIDVYWHANSPAPFSLELADKEEGFLFEVALAVQPEYRYSQLKAALAYGKPLAQLLSAPAHDGYVTTAKQRTDLETLLSSGAPASPPVDAATAARRSRLEWLKEKPGRDLQIVKLNDDEFLQDGMTFPVEYVSTSKNRQGGISYIVRLLSRHDTCIWAGGQARQYLLRFGPYLQEELDARILRGAPADITYRIVHVSKENPQAELLLGPSWDGWVPSILD